jgi:hypothetical protein
LYSCFIAIGAFWIPFSRRLIYRCMRTNQLTSSQT